VVGVVLIVRCKWLKRVWASFDLIINGFGEIQTLDLRLMRAAL
jgi:hypothetical protein